MLDSWIIEEIRRREERQREGQRPFLELPLPPPEREEEDCETREKEPKRGVVEVDYRV